MGFVDVFAGEDTKMQFSMKPNAGESGFQQWHSAMKMVARLPGGIPHEFRKTHGHNIIVAGGNAGAMLLYETTKCIFIKN
ncbi:hypothetical protein U1Q18_051098 [Sarracenia purpurea var. burkii]